MPEKETLMFVVNPTFPLGQLVMTRGVIYGQQMPSRLISVIDAIRDNIPKETLAGERARERAGTQQVLV